MAGRASNEGPHGGSQRFHNHREVDMKLIGTPAQRLQGTASLAIAAYTSYDNCVRIPILHLLTMGSMSFFLEYHVLIVP